MRLSSSPVTQSPVTTGRGISPSRARPAFVAGIDLQQRRNRRHGCARVHRLAVCRAVDDQHGDEQRRPAKVTTTAAHGLVTDMAVTVAGVATATTANGNWHITVINSTSFTLQGSTYAVDGSGGTVTLPEVVLSQTT